MKPTTRFFLLLLTLWLAACSRSEPAAMPAHHEEEKGREANPRIELSTEAAQAAGIELATVGPAAIRQVLPLYGTVQPNAERVREVVARYPGVIRSVSKAVGDSVRQGETLATVESDESLQTYAVTAPLAGVVTARRANSGEHAGEAALFTVADLSSLWVELALFPRDMPKVRVGQGVRVRATEGDLAAEGRIVYIAPLGQPGSQTLAARVLLDNAARRWAPGLYVIGDVVLAETQVPLAIRSEAVQTVDGKPTVFVNDGKGFVAQAVTLGASDGEQVEIRDRLAVGARYAVRNSFVLKSELGKGDVGHGH